MKTNPEQTICDEAERLWEAYLESEDEADRQKYYDHVRTCSEDFEQLKLNKEELLFYLIKCPFCGTGQQFENKAIGSHCNNPLCGDVVQLCKAGQHKGELMWFKDA